MQGTDYAVGDVHGCLQELFELLDHVSFNKKTDRLFSVGDLADRGPYSQETIEFFMDNEDCLFFVIGNHDLLLADFLRGTDPETYVPTLERNGGSWIINLKRDLPADYEIFKTRYLDWFSRQPYVIVVGKDTPQRFNIVHANFIRYEKRGFFNPVWYYSKRARVTAKSIDRWPIKKNPRDFVWDRNIIHVARDEQQQQPCCGPIYSGHNTTAFPTIIAQQYLIDTGISFGYKPGEPAGIDWLTLVECGSTTEVWQCATDMTIRKAEFVKKYP